jgi:hypothetical protein
METQRFQTVIARARAHRVAVLVDINDPYWEVSCVGVIQFLTKLWGGALAVIIPTDGKTIAEEFWAILSAHDPDKILCYKATGDDLKRADPAKFNSYVDQWVQGQLSSSAMEEPGLRAQMEEQLRHTNLDGFAISEELSQQLVIRICPLHYEPEITEGRARQLELTYIGRGSAPSYTASKHGVIGLTRSAALDYAARGIRVNVVCPGAVHTPMIERAIAAYPDAMKTVIDSIPLGRLGRAEEIASAVVWLSSPQASFAIGTVLVIDGGYTAR